MNLMINAPAMIGFVIAIVALGYFAYCYYVGRVLGVKRFALREMRSRISQLEKQKKECPPDSESWCRLNLVQQELEAIFQRLQMGFGAPDESITRA